MAKYTPASADLRSLSRIGHALGDEGRLRALLALCGRELCACHIVSLLRLAPSTVSKHMAVLQKAGLVSSRRSGRWVYYRAAGKDAPGEIRKALDWICKSTATERTIRRIK
jgi:DNA-binding transcriptional ArsR family regulator